MCNFWKKSAIIVKKSRNFISNFFFEICMIKKIFRKFSFGISFAKQNKINIKLSFFDEKKLKMNNFLIILVSWAT